jgi:hypothetical protein
MDTETRRVGSRYSTVSKPYSLFNLRKKTTPIHWSVGLTGAAIFIKCWPATVVLILLFAVFERWNDIDHGTFEGDMDWWDATFVAFMGIIPSVVLDFMRIITIKWWP